MRFIEVLLPYGALAVQLPPLATCFFFFVYLNKSHTFSDIRVDLPPHRASQKSLQTPWMETPQLFSVLKMKKDTRIPFRGADGPIYQQRHL